MSFVITIIIETQFLHIHFLHFLSFQYVNSPNEIIKKTTHMFFLNYIK